MNFILCGQSRLILKFECILAVKMFLHWPQNAKTLKLKGLQLEFIKQMRNEHPNFKSLPFCN